MEKIMKGKILRMLALVTAGIILTTFGLAQERVKATASADKYLISAKAGGVNYAEGEVTVSRKEGRSGLLMRRDDLEIGDRVETGANGRVEVLLNPGSYLRLGANSSFEFKTTSLDDLQIRVDRGTAMFEVFAANDFRVTIETPKGTASLIESGVYRLNVLNDGRAEIDVFDGKAQIGDATIVKKGRTAAIGTANVAVNKFDRGNRGELGDWSKSRSKDLAKMTSSLQNRDVRDSLVSSFYGGRWGMFESFGLWVFNPYSHSYCFLPFGQGWYSPYGYGFGRGLYWFDLPPVIFRSPVVAAVPVEKDPAGRGRGGVIREVEPPFKTMEKQREPIRQDWDRGRNNDGRPGRVLSEPAILTAPAANEIVPATRKGKVIDP